MEGRHGGASGSARNFAFVIRLDQPTLLPGSSQNGDLKMELSANLVQSLQSTNREPVPVSLAHDKSVSSGINSIIGRGFAPISGSY